MQAQRSDANAAADAALQAQQLAGERLVNQCRFGLTAFGALTILTASGAQTRAANVVFVVVVCVLASYATLVWLWLRRPRRHASRLKYLSVTVDISCLYALHIASLVNHSGVYEVFRAPGTWLMIGVFNGLGAVRYSARANLFSAFLTLVYGAALLVVVRHAHAVLWLDTSTFIGAGLNIFDCAIAIVFAAVPAVCAAVVAWHSEELLERSTLDAAGRASAEDRQRQILDAMADMILVKDADSKIVWANRALREAWGTSNEELLGQAYNPQSKTDERNRSLEQDALVLDTQDTVLLPDERLERKDGRILQVDTVKSPIFDSKGRVIMTVGVSRDVSDRKKLEAQLRLTETMSTVGTLAAGMAHEINNPLTYVVANLEYSGGTPAAARSMARRATSARVGVCADRSARGRRARATHRQGFEGRLARRPRPLRRRGRAAGVRIHPQIRGQRELQHHARVVRWRYISRVATVSGQCFSARPSVPESAGERGSRDPRGRSARQ